MEIWYKSNDICFIRRDLRLIELLLGNLFTVYLIYIRSFYLIITRGRGGTVYELGGLMSPQSFIIFSKIYEFLWNIFPKLNFYPQVFILKIVSPPFINKLLLVYYVIYVAPIDCSTLFIFFLYYCFCSICFHRIIGLQNQIIDPSWWCQIDNKE